MQKPEIVETADKLLAKYTVGLDKDADGVLSISAGVYVELDKKEALDEAAKALIDHPSVPQWLKDILKGTVG